MNSSGLTVIMDAAPTIGLLRIVSQHQIPTTMTTLVSRKPLLSSMFDDDTFDLLPTRFMDSPSWNMPSMFNTPFFRNGMNLLKIDSKMQPVVMGIVLIVSVALETWNERRRVRG